MVQLQYVQADGLKFQADYLSQKMQKTLFEKNLPPLPKDYLRFPDFQKNLAYVEKNRSMPENLPIDSPQEYSEYLRAMLEFHEYLDDKLPTELPKLPNELEGNEYLANLSTASLLEALLEVRNSDNSFQQHLKNIEALKIQYPQPIYTHYFDTLTACVKTFHNHGKDYSQQLIDVDREDHIDIKEDKIYCNQQKLRELIQPKLGQKRYDYAQGCFTARILELQCSFLFANSSSDEESKKIAEAPKLGFSYMNTEQKLSGLCMTYLELIPNQPIWLILNIDNSQDILPNRQYKFYCSRDYLTLSQKKGSLFYPEENNHLFNNDFLQKIAPQLPYTDNVAETIPNLPEGIKELIKPIFASNNPGLEIKKRCFLLEMLKKFPDTDYGLHFTPEEIDNLFTYASEINDAFLFRDNKAQFVIDFTENDTKEKFNQVVSDLENRLKAILTKLNDRNLVTPNEPFFIKIKEEIKKILINLPESLLEKNLAKWYEIIQHRTQDHNYSPYENIRYLKNKWLPNFFEKTDFGFKCLILLIPQEKKPNFTEQYEKMKLKCGELIPKGIEGIEVTAEKAFWQKLLSKEFSKFKNEQQIDIQKTELQQLSEKYLSIRNYLLALEKISSRLNQLPIKFEISNLQNTRQLFEALSTIHQHLSKSFLLHHAPLLLLASISLALITGAILFLPAYSNPLMICISIGAGLFLSAIYLIYEKQKELAEEKKSHDVTFNQTLETLSSFSLNLEQDSEQSFIPMHP